MVNSAPPSDRKSRPENRSSSLAPEALAGLGKLRECVAAAQNLEHLIGSRDVGPKVLAQIVPEVAAELEPFSEAIADVYLYLRGALQLPESSLSNLVEAAQVTSTKLIESLRQDPKSKFDARRRLMVERNIRESLPPLSATLCQVELLVEATSHTPVPMSVGELLSSAPDTATNRPHRTISLSGDVDELIVAIPARIGVRALSMVAAASMASGHPCTTLQAHRQDGRIELLFSDADGAGSPTAELPICPHARYNLGAVSAALGRFGCLLVHNQTGISLPQQ